MAAVARAVARPRPPSLPSPFRAARAARPPVAARRTAAPHSHVAAIATAHRKIRRGGPSEAQPALTHKHTFDSHHKHPRQTADKYMYSNDEAML